MKLNIPVDSIEAKYLTPDLRKKISGGEQTINNYTTNVSNITNINGVIKAKCISVTNISLDDTTTIIDGYTCDQYDIILVAGQTDKKENGIYRYDTTFIRYDFEAGELVAVLNGTDYANSLWKNSNNEIEIGTTLIDFEQIHIINVLNDITDVNINAPINNEVLTYKDGEWVNAEVSGLPTGVDGNILSNVEGEYLSLGNIEINEYSTNNIYSFYSPASDSTRRKIKMTCFNTEGAIIELGDIATIYPYVYLASTKTYARLLLKEASNQYIQIDPDATQVIENVYSGTTQFSVNKTSGIIKSNSLTANTYLGANSSKEIVSIASPNLIKYNTALIEDTLGVWTSVPTLTFSLEANVVYELELYLSLGNNAGRNGSIQIFTSSAAYIHRPFIIGNSNGANPAVIYINDSTATQPFNLDNSTELQVQNADSGSVVMLKGIITSTVNIPNATIQIKTRDIGSAFQCKQYSYLKISR